MKSVKTSTHTIVRHGVQLLIDCGSIALILALASTAMGEVISSHLYSQMNWSQYSTHSGSIVRIDPSTGEVAAFLGQPQDTNGDGLEVRGLAYNIRDGYLYSQMNWSNSHPHSGSIVRIDRSTGEVVAFLNQPQDNNGTGLAVEGLAYNPHDGFLYSQMNWSKSPHEGSIVRIDPSTGEVVAFLGQPRDTDGDGLEVRGLAFNLRDGYLYSQMGWSTWHPHSGSIVRIDPSTGEVVAFLGQPQDTNGNGLTVEGLAYNPQDGFLYSQMDWTPYNPHAGCIARIDPSTGEVAQFLGQPLDTNSNGLAVYGLTWVPEPSTLVLLCIGSTVALLSIWYRKANRNRTCL